MRLSTGLLASLSWECFDMRNKGNTFPHSLLGKILRFGQCDTGSLAALFPVVLSETYGTLLLASQEEAAAGAFR